MRYRQPWMLSKMCFIVRYQLRTNWSQHAGNTPPPHKTTKIVSRGYGRQVVPWPSATRFQWVVRVMWYYVKGKIAGPKSERKVVKKIKIRNIVQERTTGLAY